eukprot:TRINITY_DN1763_c0_g2_i2.p1 TRINITY_DN1763_c0_g2~~TRINITY_DN1763_c0_g2_i2.p1  ORF type:complete len:414 (+),score=99.81 TRINITY_DN1763_c0_g2_i2:341-1582(+)
MGLADTGHRKTLKENSHDIPLLITRVNELSRIVSGVAMKRDVQILEERVKSIVDSKLAVFKNSMLHDSLKSTGNMLSPRAIKINDETGHKCMTKDLLDTTFNDKIVTMQNWMKEELEMLEERMKSQSIEFKGNEEVLKRLKDSEKLNKNLNAKLAKLSSSVEDIISSKLAKLSNEQEAAARRISDIEQSYKSCVSGQKRVCSQLREEAKKVNKLKKTVIAKVTQLLAQLEMNKRATCSAISKALARPKQESLYSSEGFRAGGKSLHEGGRGVLVSDESVVNLLERFEEGSGKYRTPFSRRESLKESSVSILSEEDREFLRLIKDSIMDKRNIKDNLPRGEPEDSFYSAKSHASSYKENNYMADPCNGSAIDICTVISTFNLSISLSNYSHYLHTTNYGAVSYTHLTLPTICSV